MSNDMNHHIKVYRNVFIALMVLTGLTVGASYIRFEEMFPNALWVGLFVGLLIAFVKAYLVAANFMHLNSEREMIYWTLILTIAFLILLLFIPILWDLNNMSNHSPYLLWDINNSISNVTDH